jgi:hypothetical protein
MLWVKGSGGDERKYFSTESGLEGLVSGEIVGDCCEDGGVADARGFRLVGNCNGLSMAKLS